MISSGGFQGRYVVLAKIPAKMPLITNTSVKKAAARLAEEAMLRMNLRVSFS